MELRPPPQNLREKHSAHFLTTILQCFTLMAVAGLALMLGLQNRERTTHASFSTEGLRDIASKLKAAGATEQAARVYEDYLKTPRLDEATRAHIALGLGELHLDKGQYEQALRWFYEADSYNISELSESLGQKIVHSLERLGRVHAAQAALNARTDIDGGVVSPNAKDAVVAQVGTRKIYRSDVQKSLDALPPQLRQQLAGDGSRHSYLQKYVADEILWQKAQKLEMEKDPEVRQQLESLLKQLVVGKFIEREVVGKIQVDETDLKTYHAANRLQYDKRDAVEISVIQLATQALAEKVRISLTKGLGFAKAVQKHSIHAPSKPQGGRIPGWVSRGDDFLKLGDPPASTLISDQIFETERTDLSQIIVAAGQYFLFKIHNRRAGEKVDMNQVRPQVERDYRRMKVEERYRELISQQLQAAGVKIYPDKMDLLDKN
jgi:tetratricopeptide (TPR) repeat protein